MVLDVPPVDGTELEQTPHELRDAASAGPRNTSVYVSGSTDAAPWCSSARTASIMSASAAVLSGR